MLSIVVLCYRSNEAIIPFIEEVDRIMVNSGIPFELVLVGNYLIGTADNTATILHQLARGRDHYKVLCKPKEGMMGWDMRQGLKQCEGEVLCVIDGDGQFPVQSILRCWEILHAKEVDFVKTYRSKRHDGLRRQIISTVYNGLFHLLFPGLAVRDVNSKPKMMRRESYEKMKLNSDDWFIDAEIMLNVRRHRMSFKEIPIEFQALDERRSFVKGGAIVEFVLNLIKYRIREWFL